MKIRQLILGTCMAAASGWAASPAAANINLEFRPPLQTINAGETVNVGLYAVADGNPNFTLVSLSVVLSWDNAALRLLGSDFTGSPLLPSNFLSDPFGLNEGSPPCDGNGLWAGFTLPPGIVNATPAGTFLMNFQFEGIAAATGALVQILPSGGNKVLQVETKVLANNPPGADITGLLGGPAAINVVGSLPPAPCPFDLTADNVVDVSDLLAMLSTWGPCNSVCDCPEDFNQTGAVDVGDLLAVLGAWGTQCP